MAACSRPPKLSQPSPAAGAHRACYRPVLDEVLAWAAGSGRVEAFRPSGPCSTPAPSRRSATRSTAVRRTGGRTSAGIPNLAPSSPRGPH